MELLLSEIECRLWLLIAQKKIQSIVKLRAYDIGWTVYVSDTRCEGNNGGGRLGTR